MSYDGIQFGNRVDLFTERKLAAKVVDNILNGRTYFSRLMSQGKPFTGKTYDINVKVVDSQAGQFFKGLETLNATPSDNNILLSFAHAAFTQPEVSVMIESFANAGDTGTISLPTYKHQEAAIEAVQKVGSVIYSSTGASNQPLGLAAIVDDGTNNSSIGGQSRSTYTTLKATVTASGGTLSLAKLATLEDAITAAGIMSEEPNINITTKAIWSNYESLLQPQVRADYQANGYASLPLRASEMVSSRGESKAAAGFTSLAFRGKPVIKDDAATSQTWFMLNERYINWMGRTVVPSDYAGVLEKVNLGTDMSTIEGTGPQTMPSEYNGWFYQSPQMLPQQAGKIGRFYLIGQTVCTAFRRQGKLTGITGI